MSAQIQSEHLTYLYQANAPEIPQLWDQFVRRMDEVEHRAEPGMSYGLMYHFDHKQSKFDYMAGNAVTKWTICPRA